MRYQIKQRLMSLRGRFDILDESGEPVLHAVGKAIAIRTQYSLQSLDGEELLLIRQRVLSLLPKFDILRNGQPHALVRRDFSFRPRYSVQVEGGEDLRVRGSLLEYNYEITRGGQTVALVAKTVWSLRDNYGIEIFEPELDALVLAVVIVIDAVNATQGSSLSNLGG
ncbi:hypothetical protein Mal64_36700 [Pseudobythopirellula maris]|uniref:LURP-one-related family protein n=1 Tax=Pseudobythopirellula maris TaxID=2527991 RepID=A0A5C5ZI77_9BACT|nr:LURP-one-related family protein [Pseudobythopirellula maris]TWT86840.1 hypothetical protein Mal64_36700 [Pseudobythopirellula maris]